MSIKLGVVMDPIAAIKAYKDTTLAMLLAAQEKGWQLHYMEPPHLFVRDGVPYATQYPLQVADDNQQWYQLGESKTGALKELDIILMRVDPPFNLDYIFMTYQLQLAEQQGVLVVNSPQSLRDINEKFAITHFPQYCPPTLVSKDNARLKAFIDECKEVVVKPLDSMGGESIFRIDQQDPNHNVILETITQRGNRYIMAQRYLSEVMQKGDKRVLLIDGKPFSHGLVRLPQGNDFRGNLAVGGKGVVEKLTKREYEIGENLGQALRSKGVYFAGIDIIADHLTEINVTSPTCLREISAATGKDIAVQFLDALLPLKNDTKSIQ